MSYTESVSIPRGIFVLPNVITNLGISHAEKESPQFVCFPSPSFKAAEKHNGLLVHTCSYWAAIKSAGTTFRSTGFSQKGRAQEGSGLWKPYLSIVPIIQDLGSSKKVLPATWIKVFPS